MPVMLWNPHGQEKAGPTEALRTSEEYHCGARTQKRGTAPSLRVRRKMQVGKHGNTGIGRNLVSGLEPAMGKKGAAYFIEEYLH